jgi:hypothetical protein
VGRRGIKSKTHLLSDESVELLASAVVSYLRIAVGDKHLEDAVYWAYSTSAYICKIDGTTKFTDEQEVVKVSTKFLRHAMPPMRYRLDNIRKELLHPHSGGKSASTRNAGYFASILVYRNVHSGLSTLVTMMAALSLISEFPVEIEWAKNKILNRPITKKKMQRRLYQLLSVESPKMLYERLE